MKKSFFFLASLFMVVIHAFSQSTPTIYIGRYRFTQTIIIQECSNYNDTTLLGNSVLTQKGQRFDAVYVDQNANMAIIRIVDYKKINGQISPQFFIYNFRAKDSTDNAYKNLSQPARVTKSYGTAQRYFRIKLSDLIQDAIKDDIVKTNLALGIMNVPFKYRCQTNNQDFSGAFNFGAAIGATLRHRSWRKCTWSTIMGVSLTNLQIEPGSVRQNDSLLAKTNNFSAISFSIGMVLQYDKIQAGVFIGCDRLSQNDDKTFDWKYQGNPWVSIGFGYAIFSVQNSRPDNSQTQ